jgi:hypothetical protein
MLVALAAHERWQVHHMDAKSAFLNGVINEEVYMQQAPGFVIAGQEEKVLRLSQGPVRSTPSAQGLECQARQHTCVTWFPEDQIREWCVHEEDKRRSTHSRCLHQRSYYHRKPVVKRSSRSRPR